MTVAPGSTCGDERVQRGGGRVGEDRHPAAPEPLGLVDLNCHSYQRLLALGPSAAQPGLLAADERLVDLDRAGEPLSPGRTSTERSRCSIAHAVW